MKQEVLLEITGTSTAGGEAEQTVTLVPAQLYQKAGCWYLSYRETAASGMDGTRTTIKLVPGVRAVIARSGTSTGTLHIEPGVRTKCFYGTAAGELELDITGIELFCLLEQDGALHPEAVVRLAYTIDYEQQRLSENQVHISIKESKRT